MQNPEAKAPGRLPLQRCSSSAVKLSSSSSLALLPLLFFLLAVLNIIRVVVVRCRVGRPQRQVVAQQLHDQRTVLIRLLVESVQLSDGLVECLEKNAKNVTDHS